METDKKEKCQKEKISKAIDLSDTGCKSECEDRENLYFDLLAFSLLLAFEICIISIFHISIFDC